jgi:16S rRNA (cytosine967-C5)-methyltransferase
VQVRAPGASVLDDLVGKMDRVVLDAPCTGSGTWRRQPHAKWKLNAEQVAQRVGEQAAILEEGVRYVKPGGSLVYITCSILDDENSGQMRRFLAAHPEFEAVPAGPLLEAMAPGASAKAHLTAEGGALLTPLRTGTDGFYALVMQRRQ